MGRETSSRIIADADRTIEGWESETTGEHLARHVELARRYRRTKRLGLVAIFAGPCLLAIGYWVWGAVWAQAKTQVTADLSARVAASEQVNTDAHKTIKSDIREVRRDVVNQGDLLDALYQVQVEGASPRAAKAKVAKRRADRTDP